MIEPLKGTSWSNIKTKLAETVEWVRALTNIRIVRDGRLSEDTVQVSRGGVVIKLRGFPEGGAGAVQDPGNPGLLIYRADGTVEFFDKGDILTGYDPDPEGAAHTDWSLEFKVENGALKSFEEDDDKPVGTDATPRYDGDSSVYPEEPQTFYRIPVIRTLTIGEEEVVKRYNIAGIYRENIFCDADKGPIVELIPIG